MLAMLVASYDRRAAVGRQGGGDNRRPLRRISSTAIGINSTFPNRGQPLDKTVEMVKYVGFRWVRGGIEGLSDHGPTTVQTYLDLHQ